MPDPYNYMLNIPNPAQNVMQGVQQGFQLGQQIEETQFVREQREAAQFKAQREERERVAAANEKMLIQQELAEASKSRNPTEALSRLMIRRPQLADQLKAPFAAMNEKEQKYRLGQAQQVYSAVISGSIPTAIGLLRRDAAAYKEAGRTQDAQLLEDMAKTIELKPEVAATATGAFLAAQMGPEQFSAAYKNIGEGRRADELQPSVVEEQKAKTKKSAVEAEFAESKAVLDLKLGEAQIKKMAADSEIARMNAQVAAANAAYSRESNDLKRAELGLKVQELKDARDSKLREKIAEADSSRADIDNALNTVDSLLAVPDGVYRAALGPVDSVLPTVQQDVADFEAQLENFDAQTFMAQVSKMKGLGALSEAEGKKLSASLQTLSRKQSPERMRSALTEAGRLLLKARKTIEDKTGAPARVPDRPNAGGGMPPGFVVLGKE
jgi:hypothetical protein